MIFLRHVSILIIEEIRDLFLRPRAMLALLLCLASVGLMVYGFSRFDGLVGDLLNEGGRESVGALLIEALRRFELVRASRLVERISEWPLILPLFQFFTVTWLPTFIALVSCDIISADYSRGTLRFLFLKTTPKRYYVAKFVAHFLLYFLIHLVSFVLLVALHQHYSGNDVLANPEPYYLSFVMFFPYLFFILAGVQLVSAISKRSLGALLKIHLLWIFFLLLTLFWPHGPFRPWHLLGVVFPLEGYGLETTLVLAVWGVALFVVGFLFFSRREV